MLIVVIVGAVIVLALFSYFAVRASRVPVAVDSEEELEARRLDEGMIVGDPVPIGSADDLGIVTVVSTDSDAFVESTGAVEPLPPRDTTAGAAPNAATVSPNNTTHVGDAESTKPEAGATVAGAAPRRFDIRWAKRFETPDHLFDEATRMSLLQDLGIVRAPWGVPLLAQAYEEEPDVEHRRAALRSLAAYRHPDTQGTFDVALHSDDEEERTIAEHALTALQIRAALTS